MTTHMAMLYDTMKDMIATLNINATEALNKIPAEDMSDDEYEELAEMIQFDRF